MNSTQQMAPTPSSHHSRTSGSLASARGQTPERARPGNPAARVVRCAIYTRKSSEEGLAQEFNSLHAQREAAEAFIASQRSEGWVALPDQYDDGGFTGGNTERPGLKALMRDVEDGKVDCVVVYKVDRLSRSLMDFAKIIDVFNRKEVAFVSVTQQFNTAQSMGRLMLNVLLSFAQFEREMVSERTRDKIAASKRKGKWIGGKPVLGYDLVRLPGVTTRLEVSPTDSALVREIFDLYLEFDSLTKVCAFLNGRGLRTKQWTTAKGKSNGGRPWDKQSLLKVLTNPVYIGKVPHKKDLYNGEHSAIVAGEVFQRVRDRLWTNGKTGGMHVRNQLGALLKGILRCKPCDRAMGHTYSVRSGRPAYRYYVCQTAQKQGCQACPGGSLPAEEIEKLIVEQIRTIGRDPTLIAATFGRIDAEQGERRRALLAESAVARRRVDTLESEIRSTSLDADQSRHAGNRLADLHQQLAAAAQEAEDAAATLREAEGEAVTQEQIAAALGDFDGLWAALTPKEQIDLVHQLVARVDYDGTTQRLNITFHPAGLRSLGRPGATEANS